MSAAAKLKSSRRDAVTPRPRHVVIGSFWAIAAARHRAGRAAHRAALRRLGHSATIAIAMWATFAVCFALLASGVL
jgi:hypothetical protein